ncbi:MAG TPA: hypothetical protein VK005_03400 [Acholeplasma sp.]|nr:hypothetical protein [Acholeplasma sp.]
MFKLIKFIFKLVGFLILLSVLMPIILLVIMYKGYEAPKDDFANATSTSFEEIAATQLDEFLSDQNATSFNFTFNQANANAALKAIYAAENPNFASDDPNVPESEKKYAIPFADYGGLKGVTIGFADDQVTIEAGVEAGMSNIYYQTTIKIVFTVSIEQAEVNGATQNEYRLTIKDISIGNLPILWMYDFANWTYGQISGSDLNTLIGTMVQDFGYFDLNTKSVWIYTEDLINLIKAEDGSNEAMLEALFGFIDDGDLLDTVFSEGEGGLSIALGQMRSTKIQYVLTSQLQNDADVETMFTGQLTSLLISSLGGSGTLNYDMHEMAFNQLLDYYVGDSMNITQTLELGAHVYEISTQPIFGKFEDGKVHFTVIMTLAKQGDATKYFKTDFTLIATPSVSNDKEDLVFTIDEISIGDGILIDSTKVAVILNLIGENEIIVGNQIILADFLGEFASQGVSVEDLLVVGNYLRFELVPTGANAQILADLQDAIQNALDNVLADPDYANVQDAFDNFLADPENSDVSEILDSMNDLTPAQQQALFDALYGELGSVPGLDNLLP